MNKYRQPSPTDFTVPVPGIGDFVFAKRSMRDEIAIQVEYSRLIEGCEVPTQWLALVAGWIATFKVLTVVAPVSLDINDLDPLDPEDYAKMLKVHDALIEKERSFRRKPGEGNEASGQGSGGNDPVLVQAEVQPDQD
jgi:hypothetical protein